MGNTVTGSYITYDRSDESPIRFTINDSAGVPRNLVGATFKFTVKFKKSDSDAQKKFQKTSPSGGIDVTQSSIGIIDVTMAAADTASLAGMYYYDLEMTFTGKTTTEKQGIFHVIKDVTAP